VSLLGPYHRTENEDSDAGIFSRSSYTRHVTIMRQQRRFSTPSLRTRTQQHSAWVALLQDHPPARNVHIPFEENTSVAQTETYTSESPSPPCCKLKTDLFICQLCLLFGRTELACWNAWNHKPSIRTT